MSKIDPIAVGIYWDRLISITDEIVNTLVRTSFSTNVRESYDLSCLLFDGRGRMLAQGSYSVPSFTGTAPATLQHMLKRFPPETLSPGDVVITNDPWLGTGHMFDINVMQPIFRNGRIVGYCMSISHLPDIGGRGFSAVAREVYEEGLRLPVLKLIEKGQVSELILELFRCNVRAPEETIGDLMANASATSVGGRMLLEFMDEYGIDDISEIADVIISQSETAIRDELRKIPDGCYENAILVEGVEGTVRLACAVHIADGRARIDFSGSCDAVPSAINVPVCYTHAMACYAIKCLTTPGIPNNLGSVTPVEVTAREGSILNPVHPSPTGGRHVIGHYVAPLVFGALAGVMPDRVQADSGMLNLINVQGRNREGREVSSIFFACGGFGALKGIDGAPTTPSPSNMTSIPIEVWERLTSMTVLAKRLLPDSGGPGEFRGGLGQEIVLRNDSPHPLTVSCLSGRTEFPPLGMLGGEPGKLREISINGEVVHPKGRYVLAQGDTMTIHEAGGGGFGDPKQRSREAVLADVRNGFVSLQAAREIYGVAPAA
ncbi:hydantoinase B/oxoprolinase family protein [Stappia indica]|uniref:hydantoinase B/oxoprolinase family protein n=1 Tax=Stappia indica TaxID=538381 RepID=UPI001D193A60|nr:hydantoinase B/oxoprolinase family protein [Stappia indica]MCC4246939.1 hydantoinase B/oxoprolinase family protein [Stappia indica]